MALLLLSLALFFAGGCVAFGLGRSRTASRVGAFSAFAASVVGLVPVFSFLAQSVSAPRPAPFTLTLFPLPVGELSLGLGLLNAVFLAPALLVVAAAAIHGMGHGDGERQGGHPGAHWFFHNLLCGGMTLALLAEDAFLFLLSWEIMSVAPFFLITLRDTTPSTRSAAWTYLVAAHLGALCLLAFFALLSASAGGSLAFADFAAQAGTLAAALPGGLAGGAGLLFILALAGFGAKIGLMPLHVWLPDSYAAAPGHVAAVMSGAMSTVGIYGLMRGLTFLGTGEPWWAYALIASGAFTGFAGILQALAQADIKRSLAWSSIENAGIVCMALGVGLLAARTGHREAAALALSGGLLHMANHSLVKGLLFLSAECALRGAGSGRLHLLGGLHKRMPLVGWCFVLAGAGIAALPPLNGFAGKFLIYSGMTFGGAGVSGGPNPEYSLVFWIALFTLAGIGGFTLLCFVRLYGLAFLGEPRSAAAAEAREPDRNEVAALIILAVLCVAATAVAPRAASLCHAAATPLLYPAAESPASLKSAPAPSPNTRTARAVRNLPAPDFSPFRADSAIGILETVNATFVLFLLAVLAAWTLRRRLLRGRKTAASPTWDCGYIAPTARMQYSAGSFSRPTAWFMRTLLRQDARRPELTDPFPLRATATLATPDWIETRGYAPLFSLMSRLADWCKALQHGRTNGYILYVLVTLVALLAWKVR